MSEIDDRLREELGALLDGALDEERAAELRLRLETDDALRKEYDELRLTVAAVRGLPRARAPEELLDRVQRELARPAGRLFTLRRALAAAAVLAVAVTASVLATRGDVAPPVTFEEAARRSQPAERDTAFEDAEDAEAPRDSKDEEAKESPKKSGVARMRETSKEQEEKEQEEAEGGAPGEIADDAAAGEARLDEAEILRKRTLEALKREAPRTPQPQPEAEAAADRAEVTLKAGGKAGRSTTAPFAYTLVTAVESGKQLAVQDRLVYLAQLNQLPAQKASEHLAVFYAGAALRVGAAQSTAQGLGGATPATARVVVSDLAEAKQMFTFLSARYPVTSPSAPAATETSAKGSLLTAEVEVTPQQWQQVGGWLQFMNVQTKKNADAGVRAAEPKAKGFKSKAPTGPASPDDDKERADEKKKNAVAPKRVRIEIRYAPPPAPEKK